MGGPRDTLIGQDTRSSSVGAGDAARATVPTLVIIGHPDGNRVGERAALPDLVSVGASASVSRSAPSFVAATGGFRALEEAHISRSPVALRRSAADQFTIDVAHTNTRIRVDGERITDRVTITCQQLARGIVLELASRVSLFWTLLGPPRRDEEMGMGGVSDAIARIRRAARDVGNTDISVLVRGPTGSGKELVAQAIHRASARRGSPFVAVNMGSLPDNLAASELFGYERGAFSGATRSHRGFFEQAEGGTLFLDEIGEAPAAVQVALLRALETRTVRPVGSERDRPVNVRLVAATDRNLEQATIEGGFRGPLYHRLAGFVIEVPPLSDRPVDVAVLLHRFLKAELRELGEDGRLVDAEDGPWLSPGKIRRLVRYGWPGNVRELRNVARQIAVTSRGRAQAVLGDYVERLVATSGPSARPLPAPATASLPRRRRDPAEVGEDDLIAALRANRWQVAKAAASLGLPRPTVYDMIARSARIRKAGDLEADEIREASERCGGDRRAMAAQLEVSERGLLFRMRELGC